MDAVTQNYERYLDRLTQAYEDYLDSFELRSALKRELALEDDYQEHIQAILHQGRADELASAYTGPYAFCGGGQSAETLLRDIAISMYKAGHQIPKNTLEMLVRDPVDIVHPGMLCGLVPEGDLGVKTQISPGECGLVLFDVALWFFLRLGAQAVAAQLEAATGSSIWGPDDPDSHPVARLRERLDGYLRLNQPLRQDTYALVMRGPREAMRRHLNFACVVWIIGHEYGHLAVPSLGPPPRIMEYSEKAELWDQHRERNADRIADALVHTPWFGIDPVAALFAPVLVHTLQAFVLRTNHAAGRKAPYWTHELPEMRTGASLESVSLLGEMIDENETSKQYQVARRFWEWLWTQMDTKAMFSQDVPDGITPLSSTSAESPPSGQPASGT